jgi:hypothetical protein
MRALKILTIGMGVLIVAGTAVLIATVLKRSATPGAATVPVAAVLDEPAGTRIVGIAAIQDRLAVQLQDGGPDRVMLLDARTGNVVGRISLAR